MSNYGLRVRDSSRSIILDNNDLITRFRYSTVAAAGASGSVVLADIDGQETAEFSYALNVTWWDWDKQPHLVERIGTKIQWTPSGRPIDSVLFVFFK